MGAPRCLLHVGAAKLASIASGSLELGPQVLQTRSVASLMQFFCTSVEFATQSQPTLPERVRRTMILHAVASQTWETWTHNPREMRPVRRDACGGLKVTPTRVNTGSGGLSANSSPARLPDLLTRDHRWTRASITTKRICCRQRRLVSS